MLDSDDKVRREAVLALENALSGGSKEQAKYLLQIGVLKAARELRDIDPEGVTTWSKPLGKVIRRLEDLGEKEANGKAKQHPTPLPHTCNQTSKSPRSVRQQPEFFTPARISKALDSTSGKRGQKGHVREHQSQLDAINTFLEEVLRDATILADHNKRRTITLTDRAGALELHGFALEPSPPAR